MSDRIKSSSEKKIENALGLSKSADDLSDLDDVTSTDPNDDDKAKIDAKNEQLKKIQEKIDSLKSVDNDKEFARQIYRQLAIDSVELFHMTKAEMEIDPSPRYVEVATQAANAAKTILDGLRDIETTDKEFEIEEKKIAIRENSAGSQGNTTNIVFSGSLQEALKQLSQLDAPLIEAKAEIVKPKE